MQLTGHLQVDPDGKYYRYSETVGKGRFKEVYKAFNSQIGIDVAWSKVSADANHLDQNSLESVAQEMRRGLELDHPNIIRCFKCWQDSSNHCINLITELFTSGNLRQYRNMHKHLDLKAVKRMAKQILKGLQYLHGMDVTHGDLRCDKIYVNGHSGEIKIGDLGLATLLPFRWEDHHDHRSEFNSSVDIFAFGLCMLELITLKQLDPQHCESWRQYLEDVTDDEARSFISKCLGPAEERPNAEHMLNDPFLALKKPTPSPQPPMHQGSGLDGVGADASGMGMSVSSSQPDLLAGKQQGEQGTLSGQANGPSGTPGGGSDTSIAVGKLKGEDYEFEFSAWRGDSAHLRFRLTMSSVAAKADEQPLVLEFEFDPDTDTADSLAAELSQQFGLSPTDTEICAAALKEYLAKVGGGAGVGVGAASYRAAVRRRQDGCQEEAWGRGGGGAATAADRGDTWQCTSGMHACVRAGQHA